MFDEESPKEILKGKVAVFLSAFESSEESEEEMEALISLWRNELLGEAEKIGGKTHEEIKAFVRICEDYGEGEGLIERVRQKAEELRLQFGM